MLAVLHENRWESRVKRPFRELLQCETLESQQSCQCANTEKEKSTSFSVYIAVGGDWSREGGEW